MENAELEREVRDLGPWFHNLDLNGVQTAPDHFLGDYPRFKWERFSHAIPEDLSGATVLDVGCNAGFYSLEMKRRGAGRVLGIDQDERYLKQARLAARVLGADVEYRRVSVYETHELRERFDLVLFMGVFYHLRHPLLALDLLWEFAVGERLLFQSMLRGSSDVRELRDDYPITDRSVFEEPSFPAMHFVEKRYSHDPTNWWIPNKAGMEAMLRSAGFEIEARPEEEVFLCRRGDRPTDGVSGTDFVPPAFDPE
jgi:tRNA (mo5U34)-methyltransferase